VDFLAGGTKGVCWPRGGVDGWEDADGEAVCCHCAVRYIGMKEFLIEYENKKL